MAALPSLSMAITASSFLTTHNHPHQRNRNLFTVDKHHPNLGRRFHGPISCNFATTRCKSIIKATNTRCMALKSPSQSFSSSYSKHIIKPLHLHHKASSCYKLSCFSNSSYSSTVIDGSYSPSLPVAGDFCWVSSSLTFFADLPPLLIINIIFSIFSIIVVLVSIFVCPSITTVMHLQIGLVGVSRSFKEDLCQIVQRTDMSTPHGLRCVLSGSVLVLLKKLDNCYLIHSSVAVKGHSEKAEMEFHQTSIKERAKVEEDDTLVCVNSSGMQCLPTQSSKEFDDKYTVVSILVLADGIHSLPEIKNEEGLRNALIKLGSTPNIGAVEVFCSPRKENGSLSNVELLLNYPKLQRLL